MQYVGLQLSRMRKKQMFIVSDFGDNKIIIQSDKSIGCFDKSDGRGKLNTAGCYYPHLSTATEYTLTDDQLKDCLSALIKVGDNMGFEDSVIVYNGTTQI